MLSLVIAVTFSLWSAAGIIKTNDYNLQVKRCSFILRKETKITKDQALAYVEPIIFDYETKDWK